MGGEAGFVRVFTPAEFSPLCVYSFSQNKGGGGRSPGPSPRSATGNDPLRMLGEPEKGCKPGAEAVTR